MTIPDPLEAKAKVLESYLQGEIDALTAAREMHALSSTGAEYEYVLLDPEKWPRDLLQSKMDELAPLLEAESDKPAA